ncbi:hypothetical protein ACSNOK_17925 [Streptomyces sp. URMC 126]|uniref:hypothetical protein n=1 Tax=Streptomyces sp. URMC 126 TaxID=3423401 RepID=UPI003F195459
MSENKDDKSPAHTGLLTPDWFHDFKNKDYDSTKRKVNDLSVTVNGLSLSIESIKFAFAGLAIGGTLAKVDFTLAKADEKGVSFMGRQVFTWPWARDTSARLERRYERASSRLERRQERAQVSTKSALKHPSIASAIQVEADRKALIKTYVKVRKIGREIDRIKIKADEKKRQAEKDLETANARLTNTRSAIAEARKATQAFSRALV